GGAAPERGRRGGDAAQRLDHLQVFPGERGGGAAAAARAARRARARQDDEQVGAHRRELVLDHLLGALADGHHRDDGADADDDAERREEAPDLVAEDGDRRDAQGEERVHRRILGGWLLPPAGLPVDAGSSPVTASVTTASPSCTSPDTISVYVP